MLNPLIFIIMRVASCRKKENNILTLLCFWGHLHSGRGGREMEMVVWLCHLMGHRKYWKNVVLMRHKEIKFH